MSEFKVGSVVKLRTKNPESYPSMTIVSVPISGDRSKDYICTWYNPATYSYNTSSFPPEALELLK